MTLRPLLAVILLVALLGGCRDVPRNDASPDDTALTGLHETGSIMAANTVVINGPGWGGNHRIGWMIEEGLMVAPGDTLIVFDSVEMENYVTQSANELEALGLAVVGARAQEVANRTRTKNGIDKARLAMESAELALENQQYESKNIRDKAELDGRQAAISLEQAARDSVSQAVLDSLEIAQAQLKTLKQEARVRRLHTYLEQLVVTSPASGMVVYHREYTEEGVQTVRVGDEVNRQAPILEVTDTSVMKVDFTVHEIDRWRLDPGQPVRIVLDAYPSQEFTGILEKVDRMPRADEDGAVVRRFGAMAVIDQKDPRLKPGMSARVIIAFGGSS